MRVRRPVAIRLVGLSATIGLFAAFTLPSSHGGPSYGVAAARDIFALLGDRSPGERKHGRLTNTKAPRLPYEFAKSPVYYPVPEEEPGEMQASPKIISPLVEPETPFSVAPSPTAPPPDAPESPLPAVFTGSRGGIPIFVESPPGSSGGGRGGGSTGGGETSTSSGGTSTSSGGTSTSSGGTSTSSGGTSTSSGGTSTSSGGTSSGGEPPPPIVPEPESWLMMLAGFGFIGFMLRRRRSPAHLLGKASVCPPAGTDG